jgi:cellulose biosynthesis protein BcsQ
VIDCPPSLGLLTLNALCAADSVLIPLQCEYLPLEGLAQLKTTLERVRAGLNPRLRILGVLMTMYDGRTNLAHQVVEEVQRHFPRLIFRTIIHRSVRLSEAPSYGKLIAEYDPAGRGAQAYARPCRRSTPAKGAPPMNRRRGLGSGLDALIPGAAGDLLRQAPVEAIREKPQPAAHGLR